MKKNKNQGIGRNALLSRITKRRITTNLKKRTTRTAPKSFAWKFNNQGVKETFIQTGRRGEMGSQGREDERQGKVEDCPGYPTFLHR